ncbi:acyl-CoA-binding protein [Tenacibaculum sp. Mcav3-52]|uniref:Acyl-CoA-binding protein n=1 Tax=Tenacibaculum sp. Pbs-1 TaxID=3238748 RepID=A0AB33L6L3_9FLAO|nr:MULTISPECIES: acyl-CoA-binding protein [Tenacibaculum]GFD76019.1 acyl-CoA-binding protein [Tenacibaculum sp. KUL113]GFD82935.1 acyl-CoA-binding protein [Tenacibaculum sp. KUL118]KAF9660191.1 acyl-CoA-binding protein [Tenacibaculum mesophilum]MCG7501569.1 acyl-CoA-binding protein [Tenacibaculum sp. Mcav3-52]MCO7184851.1 acyl-CoA-binding protein [Tenacibaculum sp. XPcli2-G]
MKDDLDLKFKEAYQKASKLEEKLPPDVMLRLYAYYKQAVKGDRFTFNDNSDLRNAFKFNAWMQLRGMSESEAKKEYIKLVNSIIK